jgi:hypothetical protein
MSLSEGHRDGVSEAKSLICSVYEKEIFRRCAPQKDIDKFPFEFLS